MTTPGSVHILIAEDDPAIQELIRLQLEPCGYQVTLCDNGAEVVNLCAAMTEGPDLVIMDVMMPVLDGIEAIRLIRASESWRHIPIICLSGTHAEAGASAGADIALSKPFTRKQLYSAVEQALSIERRVDA